MTIRIKGDAAKRIKVVLSAAHWLTMVAGATLVCVPLLSSVESEFAQFSGERELARDAASRSEKIVTHDVPSAKEGIHKPRGSVLGKFEIPRLKLSYVLLEGTDDRTLAKSIGHVEGTGLIGAAGNVSIAGHRNTHFRKLEWIHRGDEIILKSADGRSYRYLVEWARLFTPYDIEVLDASHGPAVTLITCFPFEYVGSAPLRMIVRALPDEQTRIALTGPGGTSGE